jgi:hypothetical protein
LLLLWIALDLCAAYLSSKIDKSLKYLSQAGEETNDAF